MTGLDFISALLVSLFFVDKHVFLSSPQNHAHEVGLSLLSGLPFALFVTAFSRLSRLHKFSPNRSWTVQFLLIGQSVALAALALYGFQKLSNMVGSRPPTLALETLLMASAMFFSRAIWKRYSRLKNEMALRSFLIVGVNEIGREVRDYLTSLGYAGYRFRGFISLSEPSGDQSPSAEDRIVGDIHSLISVARSMFVQEIIFSRRPNTPGVLSQILHEARAVGIDVRLIPSLSETLNNRADVQYIGMLPTISIFQSKNRNLSLLLKRSIDIACAAATSIILLPFLLIVATAIKLQSPGPVFYLSKRVGYKGRVFTCFKFRTMVQNAAAMQAQIAHLNERSDILFKIAKDPRVTSLGAFLRKYSLDELPQLWNVLRGDMSLVGPRPSITSEVAQYKTAHLRRLDVVPGITGLWQVEARQDPSFESYIKLDSSYVNNWSLWLDIKILFRTVNAVITGSGT